MSTEDQTVTNETVDGAIKRTVAEAEAIRAGLEQRERDIATAKREVNEATSRFQEALLNGRSTTTLLKAKNKADARLAEICKPAGQLRERVVALRDQERNIRRQACANFDAHREKCTAAEAALVRARGLLGGSSTISHVLGQIDELVGKSMRPSAPKPTAEKEPAARPTLPTCPRCRNRQFVRRVGEHDFVCEAAHHRGLRFAVRNRDLVTA